MTKFSFIWLFLVYSIFVISQSASPQQLDKTTSKPSKTSFPDTSRKLLPSTSDEAYSDTEEEEEIRDLDVESELALEYLDIATSTTFYGEWHLIQSSDKNNKKKPATSLSNVKGLIATNPFNSQSDFVLLDSQNIDSSYMYFSFDFKELITAVKSSGDGVFTISDMSLQFYQGNDLLRSPLVNKKRCQSKEITIQIVHALTNKPFDLSVHDTKEAGVFLTMHGGDCPVSFETDLMRPRDERMMSQIWIYSLIYLIWAVPNIIVGVQKFYNSEDIDRAEAGQFLLIFTINFYTNMWHCFFIQEIAGNFGLIIVAVFNLCIWASNFGTSFRLFRSGRNPCFCAAIFFMAEMMRKCFVYSHALLLVFFMLIPIVDIIKFLREVRKPRYDSSLYFGIVLPNLLVVAYLTFYDQNFARLSTHPELAMFFFVVIFVSFVVLPLQIELKRIQLRIRRNKRYVSFKDINSEDCCPICMQLLSEIEIKVDVKENSDRLSTEDQQSAEVQKGEASPAPTPTVKTSNRIIKTDCGHLFHESCLNEWLKIKAECPSCRRVVLDQVEV